MKKNNSGVFWLGVIAAIAAFLIVAISVGQALDMPQVHQNPAGKCVKVIYPKGEGDCGMLPDLYDVVPVPFERGIEYAF